MFQKLNEKTSSKIGEMPRKARITSMPSVIEIVGAVKGGAYPDTGGAAATAATAAAAAAATAAASLDPLSSVLAVLNSNPYIIGIFYVFLNLGGRFLSMELTKRQEWFLSLPSVRPIILFAVMFIATRNLGVAFWSTTIILSIIWFLANENSKFCLIPSWRAEETNQKVEDKIYEEKMKKLQTHDHHPEEIHEETHTEQESPTTE